MAYLLLFLGLVISAFLAMRGQPLRAYTPVYFIGGSMAYTAQFVLSGLLRLYRYHSGWLPDPFRDERLMGTFAVLGIDPLIVLLYARNCRAHPYLAAAITAAGVALTEVLFLLTGAMYYPQGHWSPLITLVISFPAFLFIWRLTIGKIPIPAWWHIWAMSFWATMPMDTLFSGALGLWYYRIPLTGGDPRRDSRMIGILFNALLQAPLATLVSLGPWQRKWLAGIAAVAGLMGVETIGLVTGVIRYRHWSLWLSMLNDTFTIFAPLIYTRWYQPRQGPEPWVPPVCE